MKTKLASVLSLIVVVTVFASIVAPAAFAETVESQLPSNDQKIIVTGLQPGDVVSVNGDRGIKSVDGGWIETFARVGQPAYVTLWNEKSGMQLLGIVFPKQDAGDVVIDANQQVQLAQGGFQNRGLASPLSGMLFTPALSFSAPASGPGAGDYNAANCINANSDSAGADKCRRDASGNKKDQ